MIHCILAGLLATQCKPLPEVQNARADFSMTADQEEVHARVRCRENFFPMFGSPADLSVTCGGKRCMYDCGEEVVDCSFGWKENAMSRPLKDLKCVPQSGE